MAYARSGGRGSRTTTRSTAQKASGVSKRVNAYGGDSPSQRSKGRATAKTAPSQRSKGGAGAKAAPSQRSRGGAKTPSQKSSGRNVSGSSASPSQRSKGRQALPPAKIGKSTKRTNKRQPKSTRGRNTPPSPRKPTPGSSAKVGGSGSY